VWPLSGVAGLAGGSFRRYGLAEEGSDGVGDFGDVSFKREVASIEEVDFGVGYITAVGLCARREKEGIVLAPNGEEGRTVGGEIFMELGVKGDVFCVVEKEIELNFVVAGPGEESEIEGVRFRCDQSFIRDAVDVLPLGCFGGKHSADGFAVCGTGVAPVGLNRSPAGAQTFFVSVAILRDDPGDALGSRHCEAKTGGGAVVENVNRITLQADGVGEGGDDFREIVEGVCEVRAVLTTF